MPNPIAPTRGTNIWDSDGMASVSGRAGIGCFDAPFSGSLSYYIDSQLGPRYSGVIPLLPGDRATVNIIYDPGETGAWVEGKGSICAINAQTIAYLYGFCAYCASNTTNNNIW